MAKKETARECENYRKSVSKMGRFQKFLSMNSPLACLRNLRENICAKGHTQRAQPGVLSLISTELFLKGVDVAFRGIEGRLNSAGPTRLVGHNYSDRMYNKCLFYESL